MLTKHRKQLILERLNRDRQIVAKILSQELGLSEDTIRRDLRELASEGLLQRVHGGALPSSPAIGNLAIRSELSTAGKVSIGRSAAQIISAGQVVFLDGGTTTRELARQLPSDLKATIITHSPTIAVELIEHPSIEVILLGGHLFKHSAVTIGAATIEAIARIHADIYFMGVTGIHLDVGLTTGNLEESHIKRALMNVSADTIVLASREKLDTASPFVIAPVSDISSLIIEKSTPKEIIQNYKSAGVSVTLA